jgi:transposase-like protein
VPVAFFDALRVKTRADAVVRNKAVCLALGVLPDGTRDVLGLWIENTEGAKRHPHRRDRRPAGHPGALAAVFPASAH